MKSIAIRSIGCFICILLYLNTSAQEKYRDYVITDQGDTIKCHIKTSGTFKYKPFNAVKDDYIKVTIYNVQEYHIWQWKTAYRRVYVDGLSTTIQFLKIIERGPISLYLSEERHSIHNSNVNWDQQSDIWYIGKNSDTVKMLKSSAVGIFTKSDKKIENQLAEMLKDKKEVYLKFITEGKSDVDDIQTVVHLYNTGKELPQKTN